MKLIDNWHRAYKLASVQLAALAAFLGAYFAANPAHVTLALGLLPDWLRPYAPLVVGLLMFATATGSRVVRFKPEQSVSSE